MSDIFDQSGQKFGVNPDLLRAIAQTESSGDPTQISKDQNGNPVAYGLMQFTPATARSVGVQDPMDPNQAVPGAAKLMRGLLDASGGDEKSALLAYHGGPNQSQWGPLTRAYPEKVYNAMAQIVKSRISQNDPVVQFASQVKGPDAIPGPALAQKSGGSGDPVYDFLANGGGDTPAAQPDQAVGVPDWMDKYVTGPVAAGVSMLGSAVAAPVSNAYGILKELVSGKMGTPEGSQLAQDEAAKAQDVLTPKPTSPGGKNALKTATGAISDFFDQTKLGGMGPPEFAALTAIPSFEEASNGVKALLPETVSAKLGQTQGAIPAGSVGAAGTIPAEQARAVVASSSPELKSAVENAVQSGKPINQQVLNRYATADSLPVPMKLLPGQATGDPALISAERNSRSTNPIYAEHYNQQEQQFTQNLNAIREKAAPDIFTDNPVDLGQQVMDAYESKDAALNAQIAAKYQALRDANGGEFPLDGKQFVANADAALHKQLLYHEVPAGVRSTLNDIARTGNMTFEDFEALRTNLARTMRSPSADGNVRAAAGVIRNALEELPMPPQAQGLKSLADDARASARARFLTIESDPAYSAVVNGKTSPDQFISKFVVNGTREGAQTMRSNLAEYPQAQQAMAAGAIDMLKKKAGIINGSERMNQSSFNRALDQISPKLSSILDTEPRTDLQNLADVARWSKEQPAGSFVNNSNTVPAAIAMFGKNLAERGVNAALPGAGVGSWIRDYFGKKADLRASQKALTPGAALLYGTKK